MVRWWAGRVIGGTRRLGREVWHSIRGGSYMTSGCAPTTLPGLMSTNAPDSATGRVERRPSAARLASPQVLLQTEPHTDSWVGARSRI